jgi:hypothetical protein
MNDLVTATALHPANGSSTPDGGHPSETAEAIRLDLAEAWGEMGAAWGVAPAIARVQAYLMARQEPLTEREVREGDPIVAVLEAKEREAAAALAAHPNDAELAALREWLSAFLVFVRLFDRAVGLVPQLEPRELERSLQLLGRIPDTTILRLFDLLGGLEDDDVIGLVDALSRLSPTAARRATKLMSGVVKTVAR